MNNLVDALNDCLVRLKNGVTIEECLNLYPESAEELRPLLLAATKIKIPHRHPTAQQVDRMEARFLQQIKPSRAYFQRWMTLAAAIAAIIGILFLWGILTADSEVANEILPTISTLENIPTATPEITATVESESQADCDHSNEHPMGSRIASEFTIEYETVMAWHCQDQLGFGEIDRALRIASLADVPPEEVIARKLAGEGWGQIMKFYNVKARDLR